MILLISSTPVAGTVTRLAKWIDRLSGINCHALIQRNYSSNAFNIPFGTFECIPEWEKYLSKCINQAQILILHNICDVNLLDLIFATKRSNCCIIYQYHSPPNEPPHYDYSVLQKYNFDVIFSVAQGHSRFIPNSVPVPNVIADLPPCLVPIEKSNIIFSPHLRSTNFRWSNKFSSKDLISLQLAEKYLHGFRVRDIKNIFGRDIVTHEENLFFLQFCSIVVDDINTGLLHQTTLEALKAGCAVVTGADLQSIEDFCLAVQAPPPPFILARGIDDVIHKLISITNEKQLITNMNKSKIYSNKYLKERRLADCYLKILKQYI